MIRSIYSGKITDDMPKTVNVIVYTYQEEKFIDFNSILYVCSNKEQEASMRSKIWRYLRKQKYTVIMYNNRMLYSLSQVLGDSKLMTMMARPEELLAAMEHE